jgi:hypothetical protein
MHIPLIEGRNLSEKDPAGAAEVAVVVNQKLATVLSRLGPPVGQRVSLDPGEKPIVARVVGVVGDIRHERLSSEPKPEAYVSFEQTPLGTYSLVLDTRWNPTDVSRILRTTLDMVDSSQPFTPILPYSEYIQRNLTGPRFDTELLALFAGVALVVAATGLYGLLIYLVTTTRREWALRLALGASPADVRNSVLKQAVADALFGLVVGYGLFFIAGRLFQGMFYGITPWNLSLLATCALVVSSTCVLSAAMPAARAARVSPTEALSG